MQASTPGVRSGSRCAGGTRIGMFACRIFALARVSRFATVCSGCRNARAISAVRSPQTSRRVSATCDSGDRAGWQHVKIIRSWSSATGGTVTSSVGTASTTASVSLACLVDSRRSRSSARLRATVVIHAPGLRGTPRSGQLRSASANASCTASSASPMSPTSRATVASARPNSAR